VIIRPGNQKYPVTPQFIVIHTLLTECCRNVLRLLAEGRPKFSYVMPQRFLKYNIYNAKLVVEIYAVAFMLL
jgi:hypothetical protein